MKRAKGTELSATKPARRTGRDGAIDFALKAGAAEDAANEADHVYRVIELVGSSTQSIEDAIDAALARAHRTLRNLRWFEVLRTSGHIAQGKAEHYQVTLKVGFTVDNTA